MGKIRLMMTIILVLGFTPKSYAQTSATSIAPPGIVEINPSSAIVYTWESVQLAATGDGACNEPIETVDYVDVERYTGVWYQIASYINPNIGDLAGVTAEYTLNQDGTVKVVNKGFVGGLDGTQVMIEGVARVVDEETNAKLAVSFPEFGIIEESEYWIIELGEYYSYAVVTNSQRSSLFILNRRPTMDDATYQDIIDRLAMQCFDLERIILTPQFDEMLPPETVEFVDIERYMGLWYEIARYPVPFDEDGVAVTAEYTLNEDGTVSLINRSLIGDLEGPPNSIEGTARVVDEKTNAKLAVTFDRPELEGIEFPYWIIELDEDYQWAVVTNDTRFVLYILSRTSTMEDDVYEDILYRVVKKGFDVDRLELTPQPDELEVSTFPSPVLRTKFWYFQCQVVLTGTGTNWTIFPPTIATYDPEDILISIPYVTQFVLSPTVIYDVPYVNPYVLTLLGLPVGESIEALLAPVDDQAVTVNVEGGTGTFTVQTIP